MPLTLLFIADVVGAPGMEAVESHLPDLKHDCSADFCIVNGENAWGGKSLNQGLLERLRKAGADVITGGNHTWDRYQIHPLLKQEQDLLRPFNYPPGCSGRGSLVKMAPGGVRVAVLNLQGRVYLPTIDCPFRAAAQEVDRLRKEAESKGWPLVIFVDFHAEATAEKMALAWHLEGKVAAVIGTHTHTQTADERLLPGGTAFLTDAGMTGCHESVIGMKTEVALRRFLYQTPHKYEEAQGQPRIQGAVIQVDPDSGRALSIRRISRPDFDRGE